MRFYIDSADITRIEPLLKTGVFHGVTTNPLILRRDGVPLGRLPDLADRLLSLGAREIFLQSWGGSAAALYSNGCRLASLDGRVVVKVPATRDGLEACLKLAGKGIRTCVTAVFSSFQPLLAVSVGASYIAPYLGRLNDAGRDGHAVIAGMSDALRNMLSPCEILAASIRGLDDAARLAQNGIRCMTLSPALAEGLFCEPLTIDAARAFEEAAEELLAR